MKVLLELGLLFLISLISYGIEAILPFAFPPAIIAMFLLLALLLSGVLKEEHLECTSAFFSKNMAMFFIPAGMEIVEHLDILKSTWVYVLAISAASLLITFFVTAKAVELAERLMGAGNERTDN